MNSKRVAEMKRKTRETDITVRLNIDGQGKSRVSTGIGFLDHMLAGFARHGLFDIEVKAKGDLHIDIHHTNEDTAICLGKAFDKALADKKGIRRFGCFLLPMDEALVQTALDISGRPSFYYRVHPSVKITERENAYLLNDAKEFIKSFSHHAGINLNMDIQSGTDPHHVIEALFKCLARALDAACQIDARIKNAVPSTKGKLKE
ncbi:MAG: imidazoleglycerol-phosphate dehydratase HisB [Candidatus Omnitrophica bacterium]|nr:imidazoleglycerol-phosphate dehydratase HisB [Candidatus Omnitrophota bacterium]